MNVEDSTMEGTETDFPSPKCSGFFPIFFQHVIRIYLSLVQLQRVQAFRNAVQFCFLLFWGKCWPVFSGNDHKRSLSLKF